MFKRWLLLGLVSLIFVNGLAWAEPDPTTSTLDLGQANYEQKIGQIKSDYEQAGFKTYFEGQSRLWTENYRRRSDLNKQLPKVSLELAAKCRVEMLQLLETDYASIPVLILAGNYHLYNHQYPTALWYFQRALELAPDLLQAKLALADYYLERWQPDLAQEILAGQTDPEAQFRIGEAFLQKGDYPGAKQSLLAANPISPEFAFTRFKDLWKIAIIQGEPMVVNPTEQGNKNMGLIEGTLITELQGWRAYFAGNTVEAAKVWRSGLELNPDYKSWSGNLGWLYNRKKTPRTNNLSKDLGDPYLNSASQIEQGQAYFQSASFDSACQSFLNAIKADHRSLIGFLEVGRTFLNMKDPYKALELLNQGLAVNPNFTPLLQKRADAYLKLARDSEAKRDRSEALLRTNFGVSSKLIGVLQRFGDHGASIQLQGDLQNLSGVWVGSGNDTWSWQPWWGGPIILASVVKECWVVPVGPNLSGEALFLRLETERPEPVN